MANYTGYKNDTLGKDKTLKLLNNITPSEDQAVLILSADDNNNNYNLKELYIKFDKVNSWSLIKIFFSDGTDQNTYFTTASETGGVASFKIEDDGLIEGKNFTISNENYNYSVHPIFINLVGNVTIKKIRFEKLAVGSNFKVYGR